MSADGLWWACLLTGPNKRDNLSKKIKDARVYSDGANAWEVCVDTLIEPTKIQLWRLCWKRWPRPRTQAREEAQGTDGDVLRNAAGQWASFRHFLVDHYSKC